MIVLISDSELTLPLRGQEVDAPERRKPPFLLIHFLLLFATFALRSI